MLIIDRILVWEDGFCNFAASAAEMSSGECSGGGGSEFQQYQGLQPELFFKMSHEIYNYGEGSVRIIHIFSAKIKSYLHRNIFSNFYFFVVLSLFWVSLFLFNRVFKPQSILIQHLYIFLLRFYILMYVYVNKLVLESYESKVPLF